MLCLLKGKVNVGPQKTAALMTLSCPTFASLRKITIKNILTVLEVQVLTTSDTCRWQQGLGTRSPSADTLNQF